MTKMSSRFGNRIRDYEVLDFLGRGGFASVYKAKLLSDKTDAHTFAIKMIDKKLLSSQTHLQRVQEEAEIHSKLKHVNILEVYKCFEDKDYIYLVLELCEAGDLKHYIELRHLSEAQVSQIFSEVIEGVMYLHSNRILHRDIKAENILLSKELHVKLSDFGLATRIEDERQLMTVCGTPNSMAPEITRRRGYSFEVDVWSLGVLLYYMLTGRAVLDNHFSLDIKVGQQARDLLMKLLQKDPCQRPSLREILSHPFVNSYSRFSSIKRETLPSVADSGHGSSISASTASMNTRTRTSSGLSNSSQRYRTRSLDRQRQQTQPPLSACNQYRDNSLDRAGNHVEHNPHGSCDSKLQNDPSFSRNFATYAASSDGSKELSAPAPSISACPAFPQPISHLPPRQLQASMSKCVSAPLRPSLSVILQSGCSHVEEHANPGSPKKQQQRKATRSRSSTSGHGVMPLNTTRLKPVSQKCRDAMVHLMMSGEVSVEFIKRRPGKESVSLVMRISPDGLTVHVFQPTELLQPSTEPIVISEGLSDVYDLDSLPSQYLDKYKYAARFVQLVQSKTPRVTVYGHLGKVMYMEDGKSFELNSYSGWKVTQSGNAGMNVTNTAGSKIILPSQGDYTDFSSDMQELVSYCKNLFPFCEVLDSTMQQLSSRCPDKPCYPIIVGRRPVGVTHSSPKTALQCIVPQRTQSSAIKTSQATGHSVIKQNSSSGKKTDQNQTDEPQRNSSVLVPAGPLPQASRTQNGKSSTFVQGIGWVQKLPNGFIELQTDLGEMVCIQRDGFTYTPLDRSAVFCKHIQELPESIRSKLLLFTSR